MKKKGNKNKNRERTRCPLQEDQQLHQNKNPNTSQIALQSLEMKKNGTLLNDWNE